MGLTDAGSPLSHEETMKWASHVRKHGIVQFINLFKKQKTRRNDAFKWGDEIEYTIVKFDDKKREVKLNLKGEELLKELSLDGSDGFWTPEYGAFMIEGTPAEPFEGLDFSCLEENMRKRRKEVKKLLKSDEDLICITSFPRMGCENFTYPIAKPTPIDGLTKSIFFPDACIFPGQSRYKNTTKNIMGRRGEKPFYNLPVFKDKNTKNPLDDNYIYEKNALPDHVYLDSMGFGCGYSCLQATFQASDLDEGRILYDQLAPFCPIMMALTASAPFHRGFITDVDARWNILCHTQDCRTPEEKGLRPLNKNKFVINKSRHDSIDCYISPEGKKFNDLDILFYEEDYKTLVENGIDDLLAQHVAHLFIRDTISVFKEKIHQDDEEETGHFENIQSTVWQTMRLKPPPPNTSIGWRVEFRPCDVQITDFENAAVVTFLVLLTRVILTYKLNFLIPISKVDENIQRAQERNAAQSQTFWFRKNILSNNGYVKPDKKPCLLKERNEIRLEKTGLFTRIFIEHWNIEKNMMENAFADYMTTKSDDRNIKILHKLCKRRSSLQLKNEYNTENYKMKNKINKNAFNKKWSLQEEIIDISCLTHDDMKTENVEMGNINGRSEKENIKYGLIQNINTKKECTENKNINTKNDCIEMTIDEIINGKSIAIVKATFRMHYLTSAATLRSISPTVPPYIKGRTTTVHYKCGFYYRFYIVQLKRNEEFPGIIPLMQKYLDTLNLDVRNYCLIQRYLKLIEGRASGKMLTPASWMRKFAMEHPGYKSDSVMTEKMTYDLLKTMQSLQNGDNRCPELLGEDYKNNNCCNNY